MRLRLTADVLAALEPATLQHKATFTSTHTHSKAVGVLSIPGFRLECPLRVLSHLDVSLRVPTPSASNAGRTKGVLLLLNTGRL